MTTNEVTFTWKYGGNNVKLFGSFNDWEGEELRRDLRDYQWKVTKRLNRGAYQYKFVVDGNWCYDMEKPYLTDKDGNCNNVISVDFSLLIPFWWKLSGKKVLVAGNFNNWCGEHLNEIFLGGDKNAPTPYYYKELALPLGFYQYKFISDDRWLYDDHQPHNYFDGTLNNYRQVNSGQSELFYYFSELSGIGLQYLCYVPKDYVDGRQWPLIIYLHGAKQKGDNIQLVEEQGIPKELKNGRHLQAIVVSPQCPKQMVRGGGLSSSSSSHLHSSAPPQTQVQAKWSSLSNFLVELIEHVCRSRNVDRTMIYLTGIEMGAYGVWKLAVSNPHTYAAIAPFSGGGDRTKAKLIKHLPVWAFDNRFQESFEDSEEMVNALIDEGGICKFSVKDTDNKDSWSEWYSGEDLYNWLLSQRNS